MTIWPLLLDLLVASLLIATIVYAVRLNKRLAVLRDDRAQLQDMIKGLQKATEQADEAVGGLRLSAADAGRSLHDVVERAQSLKSDLMFITEKADGAADRLEAVLKAQREAPVAPAPAAAPQAPPVERRRQPRVDVDGVAADAKGAQSRLSSLLKQAEAQQAAPPRPAAPPPPAAAAVEEPERAPQSRAERDLLRALEGRR